MSMATLENAIMEELRTVSGIPTLKKKDLMEWSTGKVEAGEGETFYRLPVLGINCAVKIPVAKSKK